MFKGHVHNLQFHKGKTVAQWAQELNCCQATIRDHIKKHGHLDDVKPKKVYYKGKTYAEWAQELNVTTNRISGHLKKNGHLDNIGKFPKYKGKTYAEWAEELNVTYYIIKTHLAKHGHLKYVHLTSADNKLIKQLKKDQENSEIFN
jgi:predicted transcriptional regulator